VDNKVAVFVAMKSEIPDVLLKSRGKIVNVHGHDVMTTTSGIGQRHAKAAVERVCREFNPDILVKLGFCGAVDGNLGRGDLVIVSHVRHRAREIHTNLDRCPAAVATANKLFCHFGKMQTVNLPAFSQRRISPDISVVDMEGFVIVEAGLRRAIPVVIVQTVSDIVPKRFSFLALWRNIRAMKGGCQTGKDRLNSFVNEFLLTLT